MRHQMPADNKTPAIGTFLLSELAGSAGNFGTVLPLLFAVSLASGMNLSVMLIWAAVWYAGTGIWYRIPIPVEPLKAIGAIVIAEQITPHVIAASGILTGAICLIIGFFGWMNQIRRVIPEPVIRGVQLGLAFILIKSAIPGYIIPDLFFAGVSLLIILVFFCIRMRFSIPDFSALCVIGLGFILAISRAGLPDPGALILPELIIPNLNEFMTAGVHLVPPQLPLTLTNAILATTFLVSDLFKKEVNPDTLCKSVGLMSMSSSLLGGFPMCHGAGGLAAHYRFGAKTGFALIFGGILLLILAFICADPAVVMALPKGMFGVLLVVVAIELIKYGINTQKWVITGLIGLLAIPFGLAVAFCIGLVLSWILQFREDRLIRLP